MKKIFLILSSILTLTILSGCGISQSQYDSLKSILDSLQEEYDSVIAENQAMQNSLDSLQTEFNLYKEKMQPYESLDASEAEARQIEADRIIAEQKVAEEEAARAEAALLAEEEAKGYDTGITYDNIARNPDNYMDKKVKFSGKVIQLIEGTPTIQIRLAVDKDYDQIVLCEYDSSIVESRVLEGDIITIYGISSGTPISVKKLTFYFTKTPTISLFVLKMHFFSPVSI